MLTAWYAKSPDGSKRYDYTVTPWPLGFVNLGKEGKERFFSCNEDSIGLIESLGGVNEELLARMDWAYSEALLRADLDSPLAMGERSIALGYDNPPIVAEDGIPFDPSESLPLGTIVSTIHDKGKFMIYGHSGKAGNLKYDYLVTSWPEGANPDRERKMANVILREDITAVHFRGYENALSQELAKRLEKKRCGSLFSRIIGKGKSW